MRTPIEFINNLNKKKITGTMLEAALYSVNKRAKNWRDTSREKSRSSSWSVYTYRNIEKAKEKEAKYYEQKEVLLSLLTPVCIHREFAGYKRKRVYDYELEYEEMLFAAMLSHTCVWRNSYYDDEEFREVLFFDCIDKTQPQYRYYLFYHIGGHTFHTPINSCSGYSYPVEDIGFLKTTGADIEYLVSVQFIKKMVTLIESGEFIFENDLADEPLPVFDNTIREKTDCDFFCIEDVWRLVKPLLNNAALHIPEDYDYPVNNEVRKKTEERFRHLIESNHSIACKNLKKKEAGRKMKSLRSGKRYDPGKFSVGLHNFSDFEKDLNAYCLSCTEYSRQDFVLFLVSDKALVAKEINEKVQDWYKSKKVWKDLLKEFRGSQEYKFQKSLLRLLDE